MAVPAVNIVIEKGTDFEATTSKSFQTSITTANYYVLGVVNGGYR